MKNQKLLNYEVITNPRTDEWVAFVHGAGGNIRTWKFQVNDFKSHYNLLLLDLRDHGLSKFKNPPTEKYTFELLSTDIKRVLDHMGIDQTHFVALSMGSLLIQDFMIRFPERVGRTAFVGGVFKVQKAFKYLAKGFKFINQFVSYEKMYRIGSHLLMPRKRNQLARRIYQTQAKKLNRTEYLRWVDLYASFFSLLRYSFNHCFEHHQLIVMGSDDYVFLKSAKAYASNQANAHLTIIHSAGHICNIEEPDTFNRIVLDFFRGRKTETKKLRSRAPSYTS